jgi:hypothetical protein
MTTITEPVELYDGAIATLADGTHLVVHAVEGETGIFESREAGTPTYQHWSWSKDGANIYPGSSGYRVVRAADRVAPRELQSGDLVVVRGGGVFPIAVYEHRDGETYAHLPMSYVYSSLRINVRTWQTFSYGQPSLDSVVAVLEPSAVAVRS